MKIIASGRAFVRGGEGFEEEPKAFDMILKEMSCELAEDITEEMIEYYEIKDEEVINNVERHLKKRACEFAKVIHKEVEEMFNKVEDFEEDFGERRGGYGRRSGSGSQSGSMGGRSGYGQQGGGERQSGYGNRSRGRYR